MLRHLFPKFRYVTLDDGFLLRQAEENPSEFLESIGLPVIIDEAQRAPSIFRQIKMLCDTTDTVRKRLRTARKPVSLWSAIHCGGYPELADPETDWELFYANYLKSYLERDVRDLAAVHNLRTFEGVDPHGSPRFGSDGRTYLTATDCAAAAFAATQAS